MVDSAKKFPYGIQLDKKHGWRVIKKKPKKKKWWTILAIYWELYLMEEDMQDLRNQFVNRKTGRRRKSKLPEPIKSFIGDIKVEELSSAFALEFYPQCMQYHKGAKALLDWCNKHLKSKVMDTTTSDLIKNSKSFAELTNNLLKRGKLTQDWSSEWKDAVEPEYQKEVQEILDDPIFIRKDDLKQFMSVCSGKVFENPFDYVKKRVDIWNAATEYCYEQAKEMGLQGAQLLEFRTRIGRLEDAKEIPRNLKELIDFLSKERNEEKGVDDSADTIGRLIRRIKERMQDKSEKS